ncbi:MAG TPA: GH25 family lysozyme [Streptosporangiaceae bacterium]
MGAASGGRLTFSLVALAVLMASGATGVVVVGAGPGHSPGGSRTTTKMVGAAAQRAGAHNGSPTPPGSEAATAAQDRDGAAAGSAGGAAGGRAGRDNVGAAHSPTLLRELAGPLSRTGVPSRTVAHGVDVAADQHPGGAAIEWSRVAAAGYTFAAVKTTEGDYYTNPWYAGDAAGAAEAGLAVTGYHFAIPNVSGGAAQADFAVSHLGDAAGGRPRALAVDLEYNPYTAIDHTNQCYGLSATQLVGWISAFASEARRLTGQTPAVYTTAAWWGACTGDSTAFSDASLWVAGYGRGQPARPGAWRAWAVWQYTSAGTVPGIPASGSTDVSYAAGYSAAMAAADRGSGSGEAGGRGQPGPFAPAATHRAAPVPAAITSPAGATPAAEPSPVQPDLVPASVPASAAAG